MRFVWVSLMTDTVRLNRRILEEAQVRGLELECQDVGNNSLKRRATIGIAWIREQMPEGGQFLVNSFLLTEEAWLLVPAVGDGVAPGRGFAEGCR